MTVTDVRPVALLEPGTTWAQLDLRDTRIALLRTTNPCEVAKLCERWPLLHVLVALPIGCPSDMVVAVLEAGADGCLRGARPAEVQAHLAAMFRRLDLTAA